MAVRRILALALTATWGCAETPAEPASAAPPGHNVLPRAAVDASDWAEAAAEVHLEAAPTTVYAALLEEVESRAGITDLEVQEAARRLSWAEDGARVVAGVADRGGETSRSTLRVSAAELGIKGRADLARGVAAAVARRLD